MTVLEIKHDWTEAGVEQESPGCYTEHHGCFEGITFFPESSLKVGHMFALVTILSFQALHYCPLVVTITAGMDFVTVPCSLADLLQSQRCLHHFLSSIS